MLNAAGKIVDSHPEHRELLMRPWEPDQRRDFQCDGVVPGDCFTITSSAFSSFSSKSSVFVKMSLYVFPVYKW